MNSLQKASKSCHCLPCIPTYVKAGVITALAVGILAVVGYLALHWGKIPVIALGSSGGGVFLLSLATWAICHVKGASLYRKRDQANNHTSYNLNTPSETSPSSLTSSNPLDVQTTASSSPPGKNTPQDVAEALYLAITQKNVKTFKELIIQNKKNLPDILASSVTDTSHLMDAQAIYKAPVQLIIERMQDYIFLSALIECTNKSDSILRHRFQAYELYKLMKNKKANEFKEKVNSYKEDMPLILTSQVFMDADDQVIYDKLNPPSANVKTNNNTSAERILDIAIARYAEDDVFIYYEAMKTSVKQITSAHCSRRTLIRLLPEHEIKALASLLDNELKKDLAEEAVKAGSIAWAKEVYSHLEARKYIREIIYSKQDSDTKMQLIKILPIKTLQDSKYDSYPSVVKEGTIVHQMVSSLDDLDFFEKFVTYCKISIPTLLTQKSKNKEPSEQITPLEYAEALKKQEEKKADLFVKKIEILKKHPTI